MPHSARKTYGLNTPVARALDSIGDRWTLLIIRELLRGHNRYQDLQESLEGISSNLLAERLERLVQDGLAVKTLYSEKPLRTEYHLTEQGQALQAVLDALFEWGAAWCVDEHVVYPRRPYTRRIEWL